MDVNSKTNIDFLSAHWLSCSATSYVQRYVRTTGSASVCARAICCAFICAATFGVIWSVKVYFKLRGIDLFVRIPRQEADEEFCCSSTLGGF